MLETHEGIDKKIVEKLRKKDEFVKRNLGRIFFNLILFSIIIPTYCKNVFSKVLFRDIDQKRKP